MIKRLAVYCGSASPADPRYIELARSVGQTLAQRGIGLEVDAGLDHRLTRSLREQAELDGGEDLVVGERGAFDVRLAEPGKVERLHPPRISERRPCPQPTCRHSS